MKPLAFSALTVCGLDELDRHSGRGVTHVLSILDPEWPEPRGVPGLRSAFSRHVALSRRDRAGPRRRVAAEARRRRDPGVRPRRGRCASPPDPLPCRHIALDGGDADDPGAGSSARNGGRDCRSAARDPAAGVAKLPDDRVRRRASRPRRPAQRRGRRSLRHASRDCSPTSRKRCAG